VIIMKEADIAKVPSPQDRRELRNFMRWLRLWPHHGFDMIQRPRWQKYLGLTPEEVTAWNAAAAKRSALNGPAHHD
jgi:hypothetical protein